MRYSPQANRDEALHRKRAGGCDEADDRGERPEQKRGGGEDEPAHCGPDRPREQPGDPAANQATARQVYIDGIDAEGSIGDAEKKAMLDQVDQTVSNLFSPWFRSFLTIDPADYLSRLRIPVLAMDGTKDVQVPADLDLDAIDAALKKAGNTSYRLVKLDGLNHLFQHAGSGLPVEYGTIPETMSPQVLGIVKDWILAR